MNSIWQLWVDTGGTFTDCIALDPDGQGHRTKVLSSGRIRGTLTKRLGPTRYRITESWGSSRDIFRGYRFQLTEQPDRSARVIRYDLAENLLELDRDPGQLSGSFELLPGAEAPILAARLVTSTPLDADLPPMELRLGTTRATNALLERKGARTALVVTRGFADLLYIGKQQRPALFQLDIPEPQLLYQRVEEVSARMDSNGREVYPLERSELEALTQRLRAAEIETVAVALLNSYRNPAQEEQLIRHLQAAGFPRVSGSARLAPTLGYESRARTALVNAYLGPVLDRYLRNIGGALGPGSRLLVMCSDGTLRPAHSYHAKDSLLSGPAGGVVGAGSVARSLAQEQVISFDMGGTSTDVAHWAGRPDYQEHTPIAGLEIAVPSVQLDTVAAGGGSICHFDGQQLRVGPESAGSYPGPACYGAGGPLTITDVNLLLGKIDPARLPIPLQLDRAREALVDLLEEVARHTGQSPSEEALLRGLEQIANEKMAEAIRRISVARGFDPRRHSLVAFGGAGGLHACRLAEQMGMDTVVFPSDAGLLSAAGIGRARLSRLARREVLRPLSEIRSDLDAMVEKLEQQALAELIADGSRGEKTEILERSLMIRVAGQTTSLTVDYSGPEEIHKPFETAYRDLFGYFPEDLPLELERIEVRAATVVEKDHPAPASAQEYAPGSAGSLTAPFTGDNYPVYEWAALREGARVDGPAVLAHAYATAFLEKGWTAVLQPGGNWLARQVRSVERREAETEAVALELFTNRFTAIAKEMGAQLRRTAISVNVKERLDFSCALLDPKGALLVNAPHIPVHLGSLGVCARLVLQDHSLGPGDVILTNHPKYGGSHLPDLTLLQGIFTTEGTLVGYAINRAHHAEIGGSRPGSMPPDARNLAEEGVVIPPFYLLRGGTAHWNELEALLRKAPWPSRSVRENLADIHAALASLRTGSEALLGLVAEHGLARVQHYMQALQVSARKALKARLASFPEAGRSATEFLDDGHRITVHLRKKGDGLELDFRGTAGLHPANLNANRAIVHSAVMYVLRLWCGEEIPLNEGLMELVELKFPPDCFLVPEFPKDPGQCPAVVGGNTETSQRLVDTLLKALELGACSQGTMNNLVFGNDTFGYYETIGGGTGAGPGFHGRSGVHQHMTNTRITDAEELEWRYPVRLHRFCLRKGSGGKGKWKGGDGLLRELEFLQAVQLTLLSQHRKEAPYGMKGGEPGQTGRQWLLRKNGKKEPLEGMDRAELEAGDRLLIETPGGGGWGR